MGIPLGRCTRSKYPAERAAEYLVVRVMAPTACLLVTGHLLLVMLLVAETGDEFGHGREAAASTRLGPDVEALHKTALLLTVLLATHTYGQLFHATVYGTKKRQNPQADAQLSVLLPIELLKVIETIIIMSEVVVLTR